MNKATFHIDLSFVDSIPMTKRLEYMTNLRQELLESGGEISFGDSPEATILRLIFGDLTVIQHMSQSFAGRLGVAQDGFSK